MNSPLCLVLLLLTRIFPPFFLLGFLFPLAVWASEEQGRIVTVGVYENDPKIFTTPEGRPAGIFIDLLECITRREGWQLRYRAGTWKEGLERLAQGEIDLMPDVAKTPDREKRYRFHRVPVLSSWYQVYARKGHGIQSLFHLEGKKILVLEDSVQQAALQRLLKGFGLHAELLTGPDYKTLFKKTAAGEADAVVTNSLYGMTHAAQYGLENTAVVFEPSELFFAAPLHASSEILEAIDRHLEALKKDPQSAYYAILEKWTRKGVRFELPPWIRMLGVVLGIVLVTSLMASIILRRQVQARTAELMRINAEMEERIRQRTKELETAIEKAQAADRLKSAFLATISHELRTPLNSIIGFTGVLLQGLAGPLTEEQKKQLEIVRDSSRHLLALINDILDISKIEAGQLEVSHEPFDLAASIRKVVAMVRPLAEKKHVALRVELSPEITNLVSDVRRVEQILLNLLNNAIKFTERGEVTVHGTVVHDPHRPERSWIRIAVADTGIGIKPENLETIFLPFRQLDTGLRRQYEGTGLGLAICQKLSQLLGGSIEVSSEWGKGSVFTLTLPLAREMPAEKPHDYDDSPH